MTENTPLLCVGDVASLCDGDSIPRYHAKAQAPIFTFLFFSAHLPVFPRPAFHLPLANRVFFPVPASHFPAPASHFSPLRFSHPLRPVLRFPVLLFCLAIPPRPSPFLLPMPCACPPCRRARREGFALARSGASAAGLAAPWAEERVRAAKRRAFRPSAGRLKYERVRAAKRRRIGGTGMQLPGRWRNGPAAGGGAEGAERAPDENAPPGVAGGAGERQGGVSLRRAPRARPDRRAAPPRRSRSAGAARRHIRPARCRPPCRSRRPR